jgi:KTSC domain
MTIEMLPVMSSHVLALGYDHDTQELHVQYAPNLKNPRGPVVVYQGVEQKTAESVLNAPSIGSALHATIRGNYPHRTIG